MDQHGVILNNSGFTSLFLPPSSSLNFMVSFVVKYLYLGAGPVAEWLSARAPLRWPRVRRFESWARTWHHSSGHTEAASHVLQLEGPRTKIYTTMYWGDLG